MSIIFHHKRNIKNNTVHALGGLTVAIEELPEWILPTLKVGDFFSKKVGVAVCSIEDRYCRKTGRDLSLARMKLTKLTVTSLLHTSQSSSATLEDEKGNLYLVVKYPNANSIFLTGFEHGAY
jgi:hypothetical protein